MFVEESLLRQLLRTRKISAAGKEDAAVWRKVCFEQLGINILQRNVYLWRCDVRLNYSGDPKKKKKKKRRNETTTTKQPCKIVMVIMERV